MVGSSAAFYWPISTHELERLSNWLISLHKRACGTRVGLWHAEVGQEQGGGRLLKFLGQADELTKIIVIVRAQESEQVCHIVES